MQSAIQFITVDKEKCFDTKQLSVMEKEYNHESDDETEESKNDIKELFTIWGELQNRGIYSDYKYCLSNRLGEELWNKVRVTKLFQEYICRYLVFRFMPSDKQNYLEFKVEESFRKQIHSLACDSPSICLDLCQMSVRHQLFKGIHDGGLMNSNILEFYEHKCFQQCNSQFCSHNRRKGRFPITGPEWQTLRLAQYNSSKYDMYCLNCDKGAYFWKIYQVERFVRDLPKLVLDIATDCNVFSKICCFDEYYSSKGFGSFYEDIFMLAYDSPYWCLKICHYAYQYLCTNVTSVLLKARDISSNAILIIVNYLFDNKYIDVFVGVKQETDVVTTNKNPNCFYCGDYIKQYEIGGRIMDSFCVCCDGGNALWNDANVPQFIDNNPNDAFRVVSHCKAFDKFEDYNEYEQERGGSHEFYYEIYRLACESPYICLKLCEASIWNHCLYASIYVMSKRCRKRIISISLYEARQLVHSLQDVIPHELIEIIGLYVFECKKELCKSW